MRISTTVDIVSLFLEKLQMHSLVIFVRFKSGLVEVEASVSCCVRCLFEFVREQIDVPLVFLLVT